MRRNVTLTNSTVRRMPRPPQNLTLTRKQEKLIEASALIRAEPPDRIDFLHTVQCQCGIPYRNPGEAVREWDRKQGNAVMRIEAGAAIDPQDRRVRQAGLALRRETPAGPDPPGQRSRPQQLGGGRCRGLDDRLRQVARRRAQRPAAQGAERPARPAGGIDRPHGDRGGGEGGPGQYPDRDAPSTSGFPSRPTSACSGRPPSA